MAKRKDFVPYEKLQKKEQQALDRQKRRTFGDMNPVTRCPERSDAYNRKKEKYRWKEEQRRGPHPSGGVFLWV